jgi:hypothetical protein
MYVRTFRNGPHIEVARARAEEEERQDQRRRDADAAIHHARWSGPLISCELVLPEGTSPQAITVKLADEMLKPTATERLTYAIPAAERNVKICYEQSASSFDSATSCAEITLEPGRNRLPLSVVSIVVPKRYSGINCQLDETSLIYPNDERFYVMPGRHTVSCALYGGAHADHRSGSVAHLSSDSVRVPFDAPPEGGSVIIAYDVDGYQVSGRALVRRD